VYLQLHPLKNRRLSNTITHFPCKVYNVQLIVKNIIVKECKVYKQLENVTLNTHKSG